MAWLWWLLAPVLATILGAVLLWWRGRREAGVSHSDPIAEHQALLAALASGRDEPPLPVNMTVMAPRSGAPADQIASDNS